MEFSSELLARLAVQAFFWGGILGLLYSLMTLSRVLLGERSPNAFVQRLESVEYPLLGRLKPSAGIAPRGLRAVVCFVEDILFCLASAVGMILLAYVGNNGRIRWFMLFGALLGFLLFRITLGRILAHFSAVLAFAVRISLSYLAFLLLLPFRLLFRGLRALGRVLFRAVRGRIDKRRNARFHRMETKRLLDAVSVGFHCMPAVGLTERSTTEPHA